VTISAILKRAAKRAHLPTDCLPARLQQLFALETHNVTSAVIIARQSNKERMPVRDRMERGRGSKLHLRARRTASQT